MKRFLYHLAAFLRSAAGLGDLLRDIRHAFRTLFRSPGFTTVMVLMMALGIGATTALFSLTYGVLLKPLPWSEPDRIVRLQETRGGNPGRVPWTISNTTYHAWREQPATVEEIGGWMRGQLMTMAVGAGEVERLRVGRVTPSLFRVLRAQPRAGRLFSDEDAAAREGPGVIVLGFGLWQRRFGGDPEVFGRSFRLDDRLLTIVGVMPIGTVLPIAIGARREWEVVGVVDDVRQGGLSGVAPAAFGGVADPPQPEMFFTYRQRTSNVSELVYVIRGGANSATLAPMLRAILREEDPSLAIDSVMKMEDRVMHSLARPRTYAVLLGGFALFAVGIAAVGLFGVTSYMAAQRTREIGIRTALGAQPHDILRLVTKEALAILIGGLVIGLTAAFLLARSLAPLLYGVSVHDATSFVAVPMILSIVVAVACAAPARRATRVSPLAALRYQ